MNGGYITMITGFKFIFKRALSIFTLLDNFHFLLCSEKLHYIRTDHDIELTTELGNASLVSWNGGHSACEELCNHEVGQYVNNSVAKYRKISGKCECFRVTVIEHFSYSPIRISAVYSFDR